MYYTPLPHIPRRDGAFTQIQPFTYRDGETYLNELMRLRKYVESLAPLIDESQQELYDSVLEDINTAIDNINDALTEQTNTVNDAISALESTVDSEISTMVDYVNDSVQQIINNSIEVQDPVVATLIATQGSDTRTQLNAAFANPTVSVNTFGGVGDGVTDDTAAVQAAFDAASLVGGVVTGLGTFAISATVSPPEGRVQIDGLQLVALDDFDGDYLIDISPVGGTTAYPHSDSEITNCQFNSRHLTGGIRIATVLRVTVSRCRFFRFNGVGLFIDKDVDSHEVYVHNCYFAEKPYGDAPRAYVGTAIRVTSNDNRIDSCLIASAKIGIEIGASYNSVSGTHIYDCDEWGVLLTPGGSYTQVSDCYFDGVTVRVEAPWMTNFNGNAWLFNSDTPRTALLLVAKTSGSVIEGLTVTGGRLHNMKPATEITFVGTENDGGSFSGVGLTNCVIADNGFIGVETRSTRGRIAIPVNDAQAVAVDLTKHVVTGWPVRWVSTTFRKSSGIEEVSSWVVTGGSSITFQARLSELSTGTLFLEYDQSSTVYTV